MALFPKTQAQTSREFTLTAEDFRSLSARIASVSGIVLTDVKRDLVYGRLAPRLRELGCPDFAAYVRRLEGPDGAAEELILVNAITTNLTGFFREKHHFDRLEQEVLPALRRGNPTRRLRIWSAGCSSGQEPYTIAMVMKKAIANLSRLDALVLATDIDSDMVAHGAAGLYDADTTKTIPASFRGYLDAMDGGGVAMPAALKSLIRFRRLNLMGDWPMRGAFDVIFCRNVVIYFDKDTQRVLFERFASILQPDGWLFIGHSESLHRVSTRFQHVGQTAYRKLC